jgi:PAS domain S-box-containing protein
VLGVLVAESKEIDAFDQEDFEVLTAAAQQVGVAIEKARLLSTEHRRAEELKALHTTLSDITAELELPSLLSIIVERAAGLLQGTGGELGLIDEEEQEIHIVVSYNLGKDFVGSRHDIGEGAMGLVASTGEPLIIDDYQAWDKALPAYSHIHATVAVPLKVKGRLIGVFTTSTVDPDRKFDGDDMHLLTMFARQAAIAIENARLFNQAQREIGERRKIEQEIRHQKEYFESLFVNNPVAVVTADLKGTIVSWNPMAEILFGYTQEEVIGRNLDNLVAKDPTIRAEAVGYTKEVIDIGRVNSTTQRTRKDGSLVDVELLALPVIVGGEKVGFIAIYHDISERVRVEEELRRSKEAAEAASQAKSTFLANMSHELRTPLNAIIGFTRLVKRRSGDALPQKQAENLDKVLESADHLLELINAVLDLSKIEAGRVDIQPTSFSIGALVEVCLGTVQPLVKPHRISLMMEIEPGLSQMHTDQDKVRQILINLLGNAIKFTKKGSVTVSAKRHKDKIMLAVADTGIGIAEHDLERIFVEFHQADTSTTRKYGGTGLGLSISRHLAHLLNGEITVESTLGKGSTFTLVIPLRYSGSKEADTLNSDREELVASQEHLPLILAIDDDPNTIYLLKENLSEAGYRVNAAQNGREGLKKARSLQPKAIILDILLPDENGWEILSELKADPFTRSIPVIVLSIVDDTKRGYRLGAHDYLVKPFKRDSLMNALDGLNAPDRQPIHLLAVDDDPKIIDLVRQLLKGEPFQIASASNGKKALKAISHSRPDIILLDLMMPRMDGFGVIKKLRQDDELRTIPVVVLTAKTLTDDDEKWLWERNIPVIRKKNLTTKELLKELRDALSTNHLGGNVHEEASFGN